MTNIVKLKKYLAKDIDENIVWNIKYNDVDPRPFFNGIKPSDEEISHIIEVSKKLKEFYSDDFIILLDKKKSEDEKQLQEEWDIYQKKYFDYLMFVDLIFHLEEFEIKELSKHDPDSILVTINSLKSDIDNNEFDKSKLLSKYLNQLLNDVDGDNLILLNDTDVSIDQEGSYQYKNKDPDCQDHEFDTFGTEVFERLFNLCADYAESQDIRKIAVLSGMKYLYLDNDNFYFWK